MSKIKNSLISIIIMALALSAIPGCASEGNDNIVAEKEEVVLEKPVGVTEDYDVVSLRNLYQAEVYSGAINPIVEEYSFAKDGTFKKYGALPGTSVTEGTVLVYTDTKDVDKKIERMQEEISDFEDNHMSEIEFLNKDIADAKKNEYDTSVAVSEMYNWEPDEETNKDAHDGWASMFMKPDSVYKRTRQNRERLEETLVQKNELYDLEHEYKLSSLQRLQNKIIDASIVSDSAGEVVSLGFYVDGDRIAKDVPMVAIGDMNSKIIKTDYISKGNISKALEYYAIIDGKRYEVEYEVMDPDEYNRLSTNGETAYTTFHLIDPDDEVTIGQYAVIVLVKDRRIQVPCVPVDAIKKEQDSYYVYLFDGESSKYQSIEIGMKDGLYAEVLSGLSVGDKVLSGQMPKKTKNTGLVEMGDYEVTAEVGGFLYYPFSEWLVNPANSGTTYVKEVLVSNNEKVNKGQVVAKVEVIPDKIEIARLSRQIDRLQTRLVKLLKEKEENDAKNKTDRNLERNIDNNRRSTSSYLRQLNKLNKYSGIISITAPYDGIILEAEAVKEGDLVYEDSKLVQIANAELSYIILKDDKNQFNYGSPATVSFNSPEKGQVTIEGRVSTISNTYLTKAMVNEWALIAVSNEDYASLGGSTQNSNGRWDRNTYKVKSAVRSMKNVLKVPKAAVTMKDRSTYVRVIDEKGDTSWVSFIAGGSDNNYYWVVEGLEEGMTVCWE